MLASRMLFSIILVNRLSNCFATARNVAGSLASAPRRSAENCLKSLASTRDASFEDTSARAPRLRVSGMLLVSMRSAMRSSDHDELGTQCAGFLERLENRHQVAGGRAHLVDSAHDVVEIDARVEHEHARRRLIDGNRALRYHHGVAAAEFRGLAYRGALGDGHRQRAM